MPKPIKRHPAIQPLSREHHQALLLVFKIRKGLELGIEVDRIGDYINWFNQHYLTDHFTAEEKILFPLLSKNHPMVQRALKEHEEIQQLIKAANWTEKSLDQFKDLLNDHVRFEERQLFNSIQEICSESELATIEAKLTETDFCLNYSDEFWITNSK